MKPFLKWPGGKRWLFESGQFEAPQFSGRYVEPFLGGGAVFFCVRPRDALLADTNSGLVELYQVIRDEADGLVKWLVEHGRAHSHDYYYWMRGRRLRTPVTRAAQFLYLNRTCWNGLYRENRRGEFNVPIGTKSTVVFAGDDFPEWSKALTVAEIVCQDFEATIDSVVEGDFIFVDPPYTVRHDVNGFIKYNQSIFAWRDQVRLRSALGRAFKRGAKFAMTNANHDSVRNLYRGFGRKRELHRFSVIAAKSQCRTRATEMLVTKW